MYDVEKNAKRDADEVRENLKKLGVSDERADRVARRRESRAILKGNKWVEKNVGRD
jgi:hypothetical protein